MKRAGSFLILALVILGAFLLWPQPIPKPVIPNETAVVNRIAERFPDTGATRGPASVNESTTPVPMPLDDKAAPNPTVDNFKEVLAECFGPEAKDASPAALLYRWRGRGMLSQETPVENWHVRRRNGTEERVMLMISDRENTGTVKEVRLFGVDAEGLPVPKELDQRLALNPKPEYVRSLVGDGLITLHQRRQVLKFSDGSSANAEWINDELRDLQIFLGDRTLSCRAQDCQCAKASE